MSFFLKDLKNKRFLLFFPLIFLLGIFVFFLFFQKQEISFREMTNQLFLEEITTDTLSLHYTLAYPADYSISSYPLTLPKYSKETVQQTYSRIENFLFSLSKMDTSSFSREDSYCHDLLEDYFSMQKKGFSFTYFENYFSPSSGIVANFPILMAEYSFRCKKDITDYLTLLLDTPNYFSSFFEFEKQRTENGHFPASASLEETIKQCDTIITKEALNENSHFLQITFQERLSPLITQKIITVEEADFYIKENNKILENTVLTAYQKLKNSLLSLQKSSKPLQGLYKKEQGKEYYQWLVQKQTGCFLSLSELLEKLEKDYKNNLSEFLYLQKKITDFTNYNSYDPESFPLTNKEEMLKQLETFILEDFPSLSSFTNKPVFTEIKSVSPCMEEYTSPAFYLIPPIDDIRQNTIYINNSTTPQGLELFTTLAHEGYPGHLYQTVYYQLYTQKNNIPPVRHLINYGGYVEGWAIYSELYSYQYAARLFPKETRDFYSLLYQLLACDKRMQLAILSILDIKLHSCNDSLETAKDVLHEYGIIDDKTISEIHRYILEEPGNYLKYYMGYLLIMDLKEKAQTLMSSDFTDYKFHEFILNAGPSDFKHLEKRLREIYINLPPA